MELGQRGLVRGGGAWKVSVSTCNLVWLLSGGGRCEEVLCVAGPLQGAGVGGGWGSTPLSAVLKSALGQSSPWC